MTAVQREMSPDTIIILDSLNYIKGFRYQLYCAAREMKLRTCTVRFPWNPIRICGLPRTGIYRGHRRSMQRTQRVSSFRRGLFPRNVRHRMCYTPR